MEKLKSIGATVLGFIALIVIVAVIGILIGGAGWVSEHLLPWFWLAAVWTFAALIIVFLPLSIPLSTRGFAITAIYCASFLFGATAWMQGLVTTLDLWGGFAVAIGILLGGVGIVPIGLLAAMFHGEWLLFFELIGLLAVTFGCRAFAIWLGTLTDKKTMKVEEPLYFQE